VNAKAWFYGSSFHSSHLETEESPKTALKPSACSCGFDQNDETDYHHTGCELECAWCGIGAEMERWGRFCSRECSLADEGRL